MKWIYLCVLLHFLKSCLGVFVCLGVGKQLRDEEKRGRGERGQTCEVLQFTLHVVNDVCCVLVGSRWVEFGVK